MKLLNKKTKVATLALGSAAVLALGTTAAHANHTVVTVGGDGSSNIIDVEGANVNTIAFMTNYGVELRCDSSEIEGFINQGETVAIGNVVGEITSMLFYDCTATSLNIPVTVTMDAGSFEVREHPANAGDPLEVTITGVEAHMLNVPGGGTCELWAEGSVDATIYAGPTDGVNGAVELAAADFGPPETGFDLDVTAGNGSGSPAASSCGGQIETGDQAGPWYHNEATGVESRFGLDTLGAGDISHG
ncbi:hypothetical protein JL108_08685 [Aeromicrobium sp. YIM 150415]|uniref:hypothetical protein n=1 Tax=Aeromicrobium sp. YIM 150415 TaxID=2803912 RepID=UPI001965AC86|nr:hypothetical protein [Aeromicrobium sp. YIM 150415]MBM9463526.1 hypothetical protein [Aeromicrobium sp. YIM 150415]